MSALYTIHGGRLGDARATFGGEAADWLDLSTGINPNAWTRPEGVAPDWHALPDPCELARLERTAAAYFGTDPELCAAVPGSEAGLRTLGRLLGLPGLHLPLCYGTYAEAFAAPGAGSRVPSVLVVGNPNNPDGAIMSREALLAALARQEQSGGWLVVDEAFADCAPELSVAREVAENRRLIVTRSFGKFFGLAGVRLGFVLAPARLLAELRHVQGEWPVCAAALSFGMAAYADAPWITRMRAALTFAAVRLDDVLTRHGLPPRGACPLFRLADTAAAHDLFAALARRHILTRPFASHPRLLRFGLPPDAHALARLDAALTEARGDG